MPENAEVLNNLAWLYATAQDASYRNPHEALKLSRKAAEIDPKPHILDTLAESYFINGDYRAALIAIDTAISQNPPDTAYFEKQRAKFLEHLKKSGVDEPDIDFRTKDASPGISI